MKRIVLFGFLLAATLGFAAEIDELAAGHSPSEKLLKRSVIRLSAQGSAEMSLRDVADLLNDEDLLVIIQRAYAELLPEGESPEFTVRRTAGGCYRYTNCHGRETNVEEVRRCEEAERIVLLYYAYGDRFFGRFESLIQIELQARGGEACGYEVDVAAWPESSIVRWVGRSGIINRFFRSKTDELISMAVALSDRIRETASSTPAVSDA